MWTVKGIVYALHNHVLKMASWEITKNCLEHVQFVHEIMPPKSKSPYKKSIRLLKKRKTPQWQATRPIFMGTFSKSPHRLPTPQVPRPRRSHSWAGTTDPSGRNPLVKKYTTGKGEMRRWHRPVEKLLTDTSEQGYQTLRDAGFRQHLEFFRKTSESRWLS